MLWSCVPAEKDGHEGDGDGEHPDEGEHHHHQPLGDDQRVVERLDDGVVAVDADAAQVDDADGGGVHVQRVPHVAHGVAEHPAARQLDAGVERHGDHRNQHVGDCQAHHEAVGDVA